MALRRVAELTSYEYQQNVKDKDLSAPPVSPVDGDRYIVGASPTGAWVGQAGKIAWYYNATWNFDAPTEGWQTWIEDENKRYYYDGASWVEFPVGDMTKSVYDTDNDGRVDKAESVDDGTSVTTASQVKEAYDRRASYVASLKAVTFELP